MSYKKLVYFGTPVEAVRPLKALVEAGYEICLVITGKDKPRGRGQKFSYSPVKQAALDSGLKVSHCPEDAVLENADLGIVVAYGRLIKQEVLSALPLVNMHFSLLPRWRGAAPVERAILAGDKKTGVCLMALEPSLDTGPIYAATEIEITDSHTLQSLKEDLIEAGIQLLLETLKKKLPNPVPQKGEPVWAEKINLQELELNWESSPTELLRKIRLGRAWAMVNGKRLKIHSAEIYQPEMSSSKSGRTVEADSGRLSTGRLSTAHLSLEEINSAQKGDFLEDGQSNLIVGASGGWLKLLSVQSEGKKQMSGIEWYRGTRKNLKTTRK